MLYRNKPVGLMYTLLMLHLKAYAVETWEQYLSSSFIFFFYFTMIDFLEGLKSYVYLHCLDKLSVEGMEPLWLEL